MLFHLRRKKLYYDPKEYPYEKKRGGAEAAHLKKIMWGASTGKRKQRWRTGPLTGEKVPCPGKREEESSLRQEGSIAQAP